MWSELQKREAVELHGVAPHRVIVAGAPRFDEFFAMTPSTTREKFCGRIGLDPASPVLLYAYLSEFVAPREVDFVQRWIDAVRRSADPVVRSCGVLVRPHPAPMKQWRNVDLSALSARDLEEHVRQLGTALRTNADGREEGLRFVERFVRPRGRNASVTPVMVEEIERAARVGRAVERTPVARRSDA